MQRKEAQKRGQGFMQGNFNSNGGGGSGNGGGNYGNNGAYSPSETLPSMRESAPSYSRPASNSATTTTSKAKGMQLGRKPKAADLFEAIKPDVEEPLIAPTKHTNQDSVHIDIEERVSVVANKDGGLEQMEVRGVLTLKISDPASARISLALKANDESSIQFKTHPNVDKSAFKDQHIVQMRDLSRPFPANQNLEVVKWKMSTKDETAVPLTS